MRYRLQRHDGTDCSATMVPFTVLRMVPIQRYRHNADRAACDYKKKVLPVPANRKLTVRMAPGGGYVAKITKR